MRKFLFIILLISSVCCIAFENGENSETPINYVHDKTKLKTLYGRTNESFYNFTLINISITNITRINFTLEWIDYSFDPNVMGLDELDRFDLAVSGPDNDAAEALRGYSSLKHAVYVCLSWRSHYGRAGARIRCCELVVRTYPRLENDTCLCAGYLPFPAG